MTELIILGKMIWNWKKSLSKAKKDFHILPYKFLVVSDLWVFLNLALALVISIPAINVFSHGTHITVAHAMGSTIGINTMILLASCFFLISDITKRQYSLRQMKIITSGFWISNISLMVFWVALILAGAEKGKMIVEDKLSFQEIMQNISPYLTIFTFAGIGLLIGLVLLIIPALREIKNYLK
jgi:nitric oxide reductase subunit B